MLKNMGLKINWATVLVGWRGVTVNGGREVSTKEVIEYALVACEQTSYPDEAIRIAGAGLHDEELIESSLQTIVAKENLDVQYEQRKWRAFKLKDILDGIDKKDVIEQYILLCDFWSDFGQPNDMPSTIRELGVRDQNVLDAHWDWLDKEIKFLKEKTCQNPFN
jgi:hypothetical protein